MLTIPKVRCLKSLLHVAPVPLPARSLLLLVFAFLSIIVFWHSPARDTEPAPQTSGAPSFLYHYSTDVPPSRKWRLPGLRDDSATTRNKTEPRIAKVSMVYGDNDLYMKAIHSHTEHNERWGYEMYVQRQNMLGGRGYWNKPSYLLSLIVAELGKKEEDRIDWFMWVDADVILINPNVPLSLFLPPANLPSAVPTPYFIGNKDHNGLNTGTFFIRVAPWSVKMLAAAMAVPMYHPELDLTTSIDQNAMAYVFNQTSPEPSLVDEANQIGWDGTGGTEEQRRGFAVGGSAGEVLFQPRVWYNTYEWRHAYEGLPGSLLVHFPGLDDDRWEHMNRWFAELADHPDRWRLPLEDCIYPRNVSDYWDAVGKGHMTFARGTKWFFGNPYASSGVDGRAVEQGMNALAWALRYQTDTVETVREQEEKVRLLLEKVEKKGRPAVPVKATEDEEQDIEDNGRSASIVDDDET